MTGALKTKPAQRFAEEKVPVVAGTGGLIGRGRRRAAGLTDPQVALPAV